MFAQHFIPNEIYSSEDQQLKKTPFLALMQQATVITTKGLQWTKKSWFFSCIFVVVMLKVFAEVFVYTRECSRVHVAQLQFFFVVFHA